MAYISPATIASVEPLPDGDVRLVRRGISMRRLILALALVLAWAGAASAQFTLVGQNVGYCAAVTSCNFDASITAQAGDLSVVSLAFNAGSGDVCVSGVSVSDATNGAYTINASNNICDSGNTNRTVIIAYFINSGAAALTPTASWTTSSLSAYHHAVYRPTGTVTADQFNEINNNTNTTSHSHGSITSTGQGLIVTASRQSTDGGVETVATGFTAASNNQLPDSVYDYYQYKITTTGETTTATYTTTNSIKSLGAIASFLDSGGGGATCTGGLTLLGAGKCE